MRKSLSVIVPFICGIMFIGITSNSDQKPNEKDLIKEKVATEVRRLTDSATDKSMQNVSNLLPEILATKKEADKVPLLQSRIAKLEKELAYYKNLCNTKKKKKRVLGIFNRKQKQ